MARNPVINLINFSWLQIYFSVVGTKAPPTEAATEYIFSNDLSDDEEAKIQTNISFTGEGSFT